MTEWIGIEALSAELGVPVRTIYSWRARGLGPRAATFGRYLKWSRIEINKWCEAQMDEVNS